MSCQNCPNKKPFTGLMFDNVKISQDEFYRLGGFQNTSLFRNETGHYKTVMTAAYAKFKKEQVKCQK